MHPRAVAHDDTPRSLRGEGLIAPTTVSHKITPLPPIENFSTVIGLSIVLSSCAATPPNSLRRAMALSGRLHSPPKSLTPDSQPV